MKGTKRPAKKTPVKGAKNAKVEFAGGDKCVYCGKPVSGSENTIAVAARVKTRSFPVCSASCKDAAEGYVEKDKKFKKYMYLMILAAAGCILASALLANMGVLMYLGLALAGAAFVFLPYPISMFETFQRRSIKAVILICRILGAVLIVLAAIFAVYA